MHEVRIFVVRHEDFNSIAPEWWVIATDSGMSRAYGPFPANGTAEFVADKVEYYLGAHDTLPEYMDEEPLGDSPYARADG